MRDECPHGSLRRKCEICERDATIAELLAAINMLVVQRDDLLAALRNCITYMPPAFFQRGGKAAARIAEINRICDAAIAKVEGQQS